MHVLAIPKIPEIKPQDDIASIIAGAISLAQIEINDGDIFVIAQKIVSKSEDRFVNLNSIKQSKKNQTAGGIS